MNLSEAHLGCPRCHNISFVYSIERSHQNPQVLPAWKPLNLCDKDSLRGFGGPKLVPGYAEARWLKSMTNAVKGKELKILWVMEIFLDGHCLTCSIWPELVYQVCVDKHEASLLHDGRIEALYNPFRCFSHRLHSSGRSMLLEFCSLVFYEFQRSGCHSNWIFGVLSVTRSWTFCVWQGYTILFFPVAFHIGNHDIWLYSLKKVLSVAWPSWRLQRWVCGGHTNRVRAHLCSYC